MRVTKFFQQHVPIASSSRHISDALFSSPIYPMIVAGRFHFLNPSSLHIFASLAQEGQIENSFPQEFLQ
jgi:hypothetical protein